MTTARPALTAEEHALLSDVSLAEPWSLVECFARLRRETPVEMNRGGEEIAARLARLGIPCTMHEPTLFLSTPKASHLEVGGLTFDARPPSFAPSVPDGVRAQVVVVQAAAKLIEGYAPSTANLFGEGFSPIDGIGDVAGRIVAYFGTLNGDRIAQFERLGAAAVVGAGVAVHAGLTALSRARSKSAADTTRMPSNPICTASNSCTDDDDVGF